MYSLKLSNSYKDSDKVFRPILHLATPITKAVEDSTLALWPDRSMKLQLATSFTGDDELHSHTTVWRWSPEASPPKIRAAENNN